MIFLKKYFFINFSLLSGLLLILLGLFLITKLNTIEKDIAIKENYVVTLQNQGINEELNNAINDLILLAEHTKLSINENAEINKDNIQLHKLIQEFKTFTIGKEDLLDQILYINKNGNEIIKLNVKTDSIDISSTKTLQNKPDYFYIDNIKKLSSGDIYISPMDLNNEYNKIEFPAEPTISLGTPIVDKEGNMNGIILIKYLANRIINEFNQYSELSFGQNLYLNKNGNLIKSNNPQNEWGITYPENANQSFANAFPDEYKIIYTNNSGQFSSSNGYFTYSTVFPLKSHFNTESVSFKIINNSNQLINSDNYNWKLISFISTEKIKDLKWPLWKEFILLAFFIIILLAVLSWIIAASKIKRKNAEKELRESNENLESIVYDRTQELQHALEKAKESDKLKSAFLATMSHELRTPLNAIIGYSEIINKDLPIKEIIDYSKIINSSGSHLLSIIDDIFEISFIESGHSKLQIKNENLQVTLKEVNNIILSERKKLKKENIDIRMGIPDSESNLIINTDVSKLKQILLHLLKNAIKYTNEGYIKFGYTLNNNEESDKVKFYIEDTGIGIDKDKQKIIFDIFRQVDDTYTRKHEGIGISLSLSKKLISILGGKIWLESKLGEGSTFYFTIPVDAGKIFDKRIEEETIIELLNKPLQKKKTILIIDNDPSSFEFFNKIIEILNYKTILAKTLEESIEYCKSHCDIELVVMDFNFPEIISLKTIKEIKKLRPDLPIIVQTENISGEFRHKLHEIGCDEVITKPINRNELYSLFDQYLIN